MLVAVTRSEVAGHSGTLWSDRQREPPACAEHRGLPERKITTPCKISRGPT